MIPRGRGLRRRVPLPAAIPPNRQVATAGAIDVEARAEEGGKPPPPTQGKSRLLLLAKVRLN